MWYWRYVSDAGNHQPGALKGTNGRLSACPRAFDKNVNLTQAHIYASAGSLFGGPLCGEGGPFAGTLEPHCAGAGRGDHIALGVSDANGGIVEGGIDVRASLRDNATFSAT
jgi:hypothetical protein